MIPSEPPTALETDVRSLATDAQLDVSLRLVAGEAGLGRPIRHPRVQKSGLALAGHYHGVVPTRIQVLGETELSYLGSLAVDARGAAVRGFLSLGLSGIVVTGNREPPRSLLQAAQATATPLFVSSAKTSRTINAIHEVLDARLAPTTEIHGVLVDVFGVGLLLLGKSGIGKSECAVELILRGHRLVADDIVECEYRPPGMVFGSAKGILRNHLEVRGLGILNVESMFGVTSVRSRKRINVVTRLEEWDDAAEYDRLGVADDYMTILGTALRTLTIPVRPARDMGAILELVARDELLRRTGKNAARDFLTQVEQQMTLGQRPPPATSQPPPPGIAISHPPAPVHAVPSSARSLESPRAPIATRSDAPDMLRTESSAWIPVVANPNAIRTDKGEKDD